MKLQNKENLVTSSITRKKMLESAVFNSEVNNLLQEYRKIKKLVKKT